MCVYLYLHIVFNDGVMIFSKHDVSPFLLYFHSISFNSNQTPYIINNNNTKQPLFYHPIKKYTKNTTNHKNQTKQKQTNIQKD